jgi:hypothetical protein
MTNLVQHHFMSLGVVALVAGLAAGCGGPEASGETVAGDGEALVTQTIVRRGQDGKETVTVKEVTVAEQRAEAEARRQRTASGRAGAEPVGEAAQADITVDSCSDLNALWLFDAVGGGGNELCLIGAELDSISLDNFCHDTGWVLVPKTNRWVWGCRHTWSAHVRSYWPGVDSGDLLTTSPWCDEAFNAYQTRTDAGPCAQAANQLDFGFIP